MQGEEKKRGRAGEPMPDVEAMPDDMDFDEDVLRTRPAERDEETTEKAAPASEASGEIAAAQRPPADS
jgi:hypothetical protein